jgi:ParB family transcriptional regulator, chromosome partitioning protein
LRKVPVITRQANNQELLELALIENVQRADLNAMEEAEAYHQLAEDFGLSHEQIAKRVGKSRVAVTNTMRLLGLADAVKQALVDGKITEGHARALLMLSTQKAQTAALQTIMNLSLNVRQAEELVRKLTGPNRSRRRNCAATRSRRCGKTPPAQFRNTKVRYSEARQKRRHGDDLLLFR